MPEPGVFGSLEPETLEKKTRSRSRLEKKSGAGAAKKFAGSPALHKVQKYFMTMSPNPINNHPLDPIYIHPLDLTVQMILTFKDLLRYFFCTGFSNGFEG